MLYTLPFIAAMIGWLTNYLAIKMLFHPRREVRFFFCRIQGVFPKRQKALAHKLGEVVSDQLLSAEDVKQVLKESSSSPRIMEIIEEHLEHVISRKFPEALPMLSMFLNPELVDKIKNVFRSRLSGLVNAVVDELAKDLDKSLDVHQIVEEKVAAFSSDQLEEILFSIMKKEFRFIEIAGAALGFLIGLVQVALLQLSALQ